MATIMQIIIAFAFVGVGSAIIGGLFLAALLVSMGF